MNNCLDRLIKATSNLDSSSFEKELDFLGSYSGLTAYNFYKYIDEFFGEIRLCITDFEPLQSRRIFTNGLGDNEFCFAFFIDETPLLSLVFQFKENELLDIKDGYQYIQDIDYECYCHQFVVYQDDKFNFSPNEYDVKTQESIKIALDELFAQNFIGLTFIFCQTWFHRYKHLGNQISYPEGIYFRYKEQTSLMLDAIQSFLASETRKRYEFIIAEYKEYFDLTNQREAILFEQIKAHPVSLNNDNIQFYLGHREVILPDLNFV